jgi:hypothetical protein
VPTGRGLVLSQAYSLKERPSGLVASARTRKAILKMWPRNSHRSPRECVSGQTNYGRGIKSSSVSNPLIYFEEFALAQSVKRELMQLRTRTTTQMSKDVMRLAHKAAVTDSPRHSGSAAVDQVKAEACLAICRLSAAIEQNQPETNTSLLWARAIDLAQAWTRAAESPSELMQINPGHRGPGDLSRIQDTRLSSNLSINTETNGAASGAAYEGAAFIREALGTIPIGSAITFAAENIGFLLRTAIVHDTELELLAQSCTCSVDFQKETGTISFYRNDPQPSPGDAINFGRKILGQTLAKVKQKAACARFCLPIMRLVERCLRYDADRGGQN